MHEQQEIDFRRVKAAIGDRIVRFIGERLASGAPRFHAQNLRDYVAAVHPTAPASADRILRALRQDGRVAYQVVSRSQSLYEALPLDGARRVA